MMSQFPSTFFNLFLSSVTLRKKDLKDLLLGCVKSIFAFIYSFFDNLKLPPKMTSEMVESAWANIGFFSTILTQKYED